MPGRRERIKAAGFPIAAESIDGAGELPQGDIFYQPPFLRPAEMPISRVTSPKGCRSNCETGAGSVAFRGYFLNNIVGIYLVFMCLGIDEAP